MLRYCGVGVSSIHMESQGVDQALNEFICESQCKQVRYVGTSCKERSPDEAVGGVQRVPDLALPVVVVRDQAAAAGPLVRDAPAALARRVDLPRGATSDTGSASVMGRHCFHAARSMRLLDAGSTDKPPHMEAMACNCLNKNTAHTR